MKRIALMCATVLLTACGGGGDGGTTQPQPVASVRIAPATLTIDIGKTLQLSASARDASGNTLVGKTITWSSSNSPVASVNPASGLVTAAGVGTAYIIAVSDGKRDSVQVTVQPSNSATAPQVSGISPALLVPGGSAILTGVRFGVGAGANVVRIDGVQVTVATATATEITISIPAAGFPCLPTHNASITVTAAGETGVFSHPFAPATQRSLTIGQSLTLEPGAASLTCNEFSVTGGRYIISAFNASTAQAAQISFQLRGAAATAAASTIAAVPAPAAELAERTLAEPLPIRGFAPGFQRDEMRRRASAHRDLMEGSREAVRRAGSPFPLLRAARAARSSAPAASAGPGTFSARPSGAVLAETTTVRIPNITGGNFCSNFTAAQARTVYVGTKVIIKEDVANPLFGQMDAMYAQLGAEFDNVMAPILATNFGDFLTLDDSLDNNDRLVMIFSSKVNDFNRVAGFVVSCDFYPQSTFQSSNVGETFYAIVPTSSLGGTGPGTRDGWYRSIRSVVIHEAKHIVSYSEHLIRSGRNNPVFEDQWMEEGTAMHAEELWARQIYGTTLRGNAGYRQTVYCDVRPNPATWPECAGRPYVMIDHFAFNYDYLEDVENLTPLGPPTSDDFTFYGSAWSLIRWAIDHYAVTDGDLLKPMTQDIARRGIANLSARTGRSWPEMLADWTLASAVDDYPAFTPQRTQLALLSWNTRDIYLNMNRDLQGFPRPFPLVPRAVSFGTFTQEVPTVRGGTAAFFELSGAQSAKQLLELRGAGGGVVPSTLGLAIVRVQ